MGAGEQECEYQGRVDGKISGKAMLVGSSLRRMAAGTPGSDLSMERALLLL
jgi:hypothetical protein